MKLFCIPYAGGGTEAFDGWQELLAPAVEVRIAELPGRGDRFGTRLPDDMPELVDELALQSDELSRGPYALLGYSFGAYAAHALAVRFQALGRPPLRLVVGGAPAPFLPRTRPEYHRLTDPELIEELRVMNGTAPEVLAAPQLMALLLPILRADFRVAETYPPNSDRVDCPLTVFGGTTDPLTSAEELAAWTRLGADGSTVRQYDGDHFVLRSQRSRICRSVRADLALDALNAAS